MVGTFGDASTDLDRVIKGIAESRVLFLSRKEGRLVTDAWAGQVLGQHRRFFWPSSSGARRPVWYPPTSGAGGRL